MLIIRVLLPLMILANSILAQTQAQRPLPEKILAEEIARLTAQAAQPEIYFAQAQERDSLLALLAGEPEEQPQHIRQLIELLDTPWAMQFAVLSQVLEKIGPAARMAVAEQLSASNPRVATARLLSVFEKLGESTDEALLAPYLEQGTPAEKISSARCLAAW